MYSQFTTLTEPATRSILTTQANPLTIKKERFRKYPFYGNNLSSPSSTLSPYHHFSVHVSPIQSIVFTSSSPTPPLSPPTPAAG
mmetsp:Transcript_691/g.1946  ORF Transcript_691/g.1946 Transcript_691/m.1946 type:complete len:84 (-) Transcript_691:278-529(-)